MSKRLPIPLLIAALGLLVLPPVLLALGLTMTSATEVVILRAGLHGAEHSGRPYRPRLVRPRRLVRSCGLRRRAAPAQLGCTTRFSDPTVAGVLIVAVIAAAFGFLILRRRGVYFSLLTLALAAMLYAVSFRWTEVTGGENGLGGITRPTLFGLNLESSTDLLLVCRGHRVPGADPVMALP